MRRKKRRRTASLEDVASATEYTGALPFLPDPEGKMPAGTDEGEQD